MISSFGFLALRLCVGVLLVHHGFEKLNDIENFATAFVKPLHLPFPVALSYIAAFSEIAGSWMLITGLGVRFGALAIFGTMSIAIYHAIMINGFNIYLLELLGLYWGGALCLILNGGGMFSIDYLILQRISSGHMFHERKPQQFEASNGYFKA